MHQAQREILEASRPYPDGIEMAVIPKLDTGGAFGGSPVQNDSSTSLPPQQKPLVDRAKNLTVVTGPTLYCLPDLPELRDAAVRRHPGAQGVSTSDRPRGFRQGGARRRGRAGHMNCCRKRTGPTTSQSECYPYDPTRPASCSPRRATRTVPRSSSSATRPGPGLSARRSLIEHLSQGRHQLRFLNAPSEASPAFFADRSAARAARRLDRTAGSEPDLFADVH